MARHGSATLLPPNLQIVTHRPSKRTMARSASPYCSPGASQLPTAAGICRRQGLGRQLLPRVDTVVPERRHIWRHMHRQPPQQYPGSRLQWKTGGADAPLATNSIILPFHGIYRDGVHEKRSLRGRQEGRGETCSVLYDVDTAPSRGLSSGRQGFTATSVRHSLPTYYHHGFFRPVWFLAVYPRQFVEVVWLPALDSAGRDALGNMAVCWVVVPTSL